VSYIDPLLPLILIVALASFLGTWRHPTPRPWLLFSSIVGLPIISLRSWLLFAKPLESRYDRHISMLLPSWQAIRANSETVHEALGLLWYWHKGYI
jgi:hypothetical protein